MKVAVVTPTIGSEHLSQCLESVQNQTYENLTHYIFLDGEEYTDKIHSTLYEKSGKRTIKTVHLEDNVGKGWYGHRVYAACSFLVNADIICYLDEDNWYDSNHVQKMVEFIDKGNQWAYSLRKICDKEGNFLCNDDCESLGKWPVYFDENVFHIDTSSFGVLQEVAVKIGQAWYGKWGADRQFFGAIKQYFPKFSCTNDYTLNYRLDGNPKSVTREFFENGNSINKQKYNGDFPWLKQETGLQIGPGITLV